MTTLTLGSIGEALDIQLRQGADFGPVTGLMKNPDGSPVNLTGCIFRGQIKKTHHDRLAILTFRTTIVNAPGGRYSFWLTHADTLRLKAGASLTDAESIYLWDFELQDAANRVIPLYYGKVRVLREVTGKGI